MYTVYILKSSNGKLYKGYTNNLKRRLKEHKQGKTITTKHIPALEVIYTENFSIIIEARKREKYFKSATGRRYLKNKVILPA